DTGKKVTLNDQNNWIDQISGLEKMKNGKQIKYTWSEDVPEGYTMTGNVTNGTLTTITNTHGPEEVEIKVRKVWDDSDNLAKKRPASITVQLYADGIAAGTVKLDESNSWSWNWTELKNCTDANGTREIVYTVAELDIPEGYVCKVTRDGDKSFVIRNTYDTGNLIIQKTFDIQQPEIVPEEEEMTTDIEVVKVWDDNDNKDGNRPASITVRLFAGGKEVKSAMLTAANGWSKTFGGLPKFVDGHPIHYSVKEDPVKWYVTEIRGFTITNRYQPEVTSVEVRKEWDDNGNTKLRPKSIHMKLSNGMSVELNEKNGWCGVITELPKYVNGKEAVYTWTESEVLGYQIKSTEADGNLTVITNELYHNDGTPKGKKPATRGPGTEQLDDYDTPLGVNVIINHVGDCFD
ncbi:MAG: Cna B-type domain-containing protein, partial [Clostridia bacterium]|nr:Cna B-type domain-containing protein [Clostridia bacterium]